MRKLTDPQAAEIEEAVEGRSQRFAEHTVEWERKRSVCRELCELGYMTCHFFEEDGRQFVVFKVTTLGVAAYECWKADR